ncbi:MAG: TlpA disulfide reductase family protein [Chitinophagaceae bacterium]
MKKTAFLFLFLPFLVQSQTRVPSTFAMESPAFEEQFNHHVVPTVKGQLLHISPEEMKHITVNYTLVTFSGQVRKTTTLDKDGRFSFALDYALPCQQIWFGIDSLFYASIYANTDLFIELNYKKIKASGTELEYNGDGLRYMGKDGPLNTYMNDFVLYRREEQISLDSRIQTALRENQSTPVNWHAGFQPLYDSLAMIQAEYIQKHPSPYAWLLENDFLSGYYSQACIYYLGHTMDDSMMQRIKSHETYLVSNNSAFFYNYLSFYITGIAYQRIRVSWRDIKGASDLNESEKHAIDSLQMGSQVLPGDSGVYTKEKLTSWEKILRPKVNQKRTALVLSECLRMADSLFSAPMADRLKLQFNDSRDMLEQTIALQRILPSLHSKWCRRVASDSYKKTNQKIAEANKAINGSGNAIGAAGFGKPQQTSFGASLYKINNMKANEFLSRLHSSFPGKAIVVDLWATWCLPCLGEMPHSKQLQLASKDLSVVFVYLCTSKSSDEGKWRRKVGELTQPGVHFFIDEKLDAELAQYFSFSGYPGYAFINRKGVFQPGAFKWLSEIKDKNDLATLVNRE